MAQSIWRCARSARRASFQNSRGSGPMAMADDRPSNELESREPTVQDLRDLCRELNQRGAKYVVIGGFALRAANYNRRTMDVDLIVAADADNEARVFAALSTLPDNAVRELRPGEL